MQFSDIFKRLAKHAEGNFLRFSFGAMQFLHDGGAVEITSAPIGGTSDTVFVNKKTVDCISRYSGEQTWSILGKNLSLETRQDWLKDQTLLCSQEAEEQKWPESPARQIPWATLETATKTTLDKILFSPDLSAQKHQTGFTIAAPDLARMVKETLYAVPKKDPRSVLLGALFDFEDPDTLHIVATDGKKMAVSSGSISAQIGELENRIIPRKTLETLGKTLKNEKGHVAISFEGESIFFQSGAYSLRSSLIDGHYPNYRLCIPKKTEYRIPLNRKKFMDLVKDASHTAKDENNTVIFRFEQWKASAFSSTYGEGSFSGCISTDYQGAPFYLAFSHVFLLDTLKNMTGENVLLRVQAPDAPAIFQNAGENGINLVMPIKFDTLPEWAQTLYQGAAVPDSQTVTIDHQGAAVPDSQTLTVEHQGAAVPDSQTLTVEHQGAAVPDSQTVTIDHFSPHSTLGRSPPLNRASYFF